MSVFGDKAAVDKMIQQFKTAQEVDAWLGEEHRKAREQFTEVAVSLRALCESQPQWKDYVTEALQRGN
ncbi:hypothetical protein SEA_SCHMIDT_61 [Gordonia phage Schmidt]|uniref:Uncharacterized protein n=1 Tax=Gordonia phage Schmidt TaxID=2301697 RepID=A0A385E0B1_9CAUD|nr:hypothetical protein KDJ59_gp61 [Gordonia phage Schmidt]AXQ65181.1 hypothetical protein SEA_SCHMIDT_61 [Gordonia phage Schmidt]